MEITAEQISAEEAHQNMNETSSEEILEGIPEKKEDSSEEILEGIPEKKEDSSEEEINLD